MMIRFVAILACLALTLPALANGGDSEPIRVTAITQSGNAMPTPDAPRAVVTHVEFEALSGGCTEAGHFSLRVEQKEDVQKVTVIRNHPDGCEGVARFIPLSLDTGELQAYKPVRVMNSFPVTYRFVQ